MEVGKGSMSLQKALEDSMFADTKAQVDFLGQTSVTLFILQLGCFMVHRDSKSTNFTVTKWGDSKEDILFVDKHGSLNLAAGNEETTSSGRTTPSLRPRRSKRHTREIHEQLSAGGL